MLTAAAIKAKAAELGFDLCGIAPASDHPELTFFREWIDRGYAGDMAYLNRSAHGRADVRNVMRSARTVIVTATVYNTDRPYTTECKDPSRAHIARYAWGDDYHDVIGERMQQLLSHPGEQLLHPFADHVVVVVAPGIARDVRARGVFALRRVWAVGVVNGRGDDDRAGGSHDVADVGAAMGRTIQIRHVAGVSAVDPLAEECQLRMIRGRRDAAEIETEFRRFRLDCRRGQHSPSTLLLTELTQHVREDAAVLE